MLNDIELKIFNMIKEETLSKREIATKLGYKSITGNVRRAIETLIEKNMIDYTIPDKPTRRNQKYKIN